jgi:hypothetical protein
MTLTGTALLPWLLEQLEIILFGVALPKESRQVQPLLIMVGFTQRHFASAISNNDNNNNGCTYLGSLDSETYN